MHPHHHPQALPGSSRERPAARPPRDGASAEPRSGCRANVVSRSRPPAPHRGLTIAAQCARPALDQLLIVAPRDPWPPSGAAASSTLAPAALAPPRPPQKLGSFPLPSPPPVRPSVQRFGVQQRSRGPEPSSNRTTVGPRRAAKLPFGPTRKRRAEDAARLRLLQRLVRRRTATLRT